MEQEGTAPRPLRDAVRRAGLLVGPLAALALVLALPEPGPGGSGLAPGGRCTVALAVWMGIWWMTEALPLAATALLPLAVLPLGGAASMRAAAAPYAHELIFLFLGGFLLALAMQRWGLDRRVALAVLRAVGTRPAHIVGGFMAVTALLSMWVSNTATAVVMLPIAISVVELVEDEPGGAFAPALLLGIAYAASIGGLGTLIGTPPNLFLASYAERHLGITIGFGAWMAVGIPLVVVFLPVAWWLLTGLLYPVGRAPLPGARELFEHEARGLGPIRRPELLTAAVFLAAATAWITRPLWVDLRVGGAQPFAHLTDPGIAVTAALLLFALPAERGGRERVLDWATAVKLPWGLLLLFGGGLSLAAAIEANGVGEALGAQLGGLAGLPGWLVVGVATALVIFLTELTSNTATAAALVPVLAALAPALGIPPLALAVSVALAASCAFMLPVATPPNAVVFGSDRIEAGQMMRAGFLLNLVGIALIPAVTLLLALPLLVGPR